jgi:hypothetical protein
VGRLEETLAAGDVTRARQEIRDHGGIVTVEADEREIRLYSEQGHIAAAMLRDTGINTSLFGSGGVIRNSRDLNYHEIFFDREPNS